MGTKADPGKYDCHARARADEPKFTLLGRDEHAADLVNRWAAEREMAIALGKKPVSDRAKVTDAREVAQAMREYRKRYLAQRAE